MRLQYTRNAAIPAILGVILCAQAAHAQHGKIVPSPPPAPHLKVAHAAAPKQEKPVPPVTKPGEAARKAAQATDKVEDKLEHSVRSEPNRLLAGITLTASERTQIEAIEKKYADQLKLLVKQDQAADKAGTPTSDITQVTALRDAERAELRAALTSTQQAQFDTNVADLGKPVPPATKPDKAARKAAEAADRAEDKLERLVRTQPAQLLRGITLTTSERTQIQAIEKKYDDQLRVLVKQAQAADKGGTPTSDITQATALRDAERAELRAVLTSSQQAQFDANVARVDAPPKKP